MNHIMRLLILSMLCSLSTSLRSDAIHLVMPMLSDSATNHVYFHDLMQKAGIAAGYHVQIKPLLLPQKRATQFLDNGSIDVFWLVGSAQRDEQYGYIETGLTGGLIGQRVFFIRPGEQERFSQVRTLKELADSGLMAGLGAGWFDAKVWEANGLPYAEQSGNWKAIYKLLATNRRYDYFPRGINEILQESVSHPELVIESELLLRYSRDFRFYFSKKFVQENPEDFEKLSQSIKLAQSEGLIEQLAELYWEEDIRRLDIANRKIFVLKTPQ